MNEAMPAILIGSNLFMVGLTLALLIAATPGELKDGEVKVVFVLSILWPLGLGALCAAWLVGKISEGGEGK